MTLAGLNQRCDMSELSPGRSLARLKRANEPMGRGPRPGRDLRRTPSSNSLVGVCAGQRDASRFAHGRGPGHG
eukprot:9488557-Pyramimonas_sp.AAC.1